MVATMARIDDRKAKATTCFADDCVARAITASCYSTQRKSQCLAFLSSISELFSVVQATEVIRNILEDFVEVENRLEACLSFYSSHIRHVIHNFLIGFNVLTLSEGIRFAHYDGSSFADASSRFGDLILCWGVASLLHDIGYEVERYPDIELLRQQRNTFWNFMTSRPVATELPVMYHAVAASETPYGMLYRRVAELSTDVRLSLTDFEMLFKRPAQPFMNSVKYDHAIISAVKFLWAVHERAPALVNSPVIQDAAVAMALHNFRYKNSNVTLDSSDWRAIVPYLLIVADEIHEWNRDREDVDYLLASRAPEVEADKSNMASTELLSAIFETQTATLSIRHALVDPDKELQSKLHCEKRIELQQQNYPVLVNFLEPRNLWKEHLDYRGQEEEASGNSQDIFIKEFRAIAYRNESAHYTEGRVLGNTKPINTKRLLIPNNLYHIRLLRRFGSSIDWYVQTTFPI